MRVVVIGAGAVGSLLGGSLALARHDVVLLRRSAPADAQRAQLTLSGPSSRAATVELGVTGSPGGIPGAPDVVLVAVKMPDLPSAADAAGAWPEADVVAVENGIGADELLMEKRSRGGLVAGSLTASVELSGGAVHRLSDGGLGLAGVRGNVDGVIRTLVDSFAEGGLRTRELPDARAMRWSKLLANLVGNASSAILDVDPDAVYRSPSLFEVERRQLREALSVMRGLGLRPVALPGADVRLLVAADRLPAWLVRPVMHRVVSGARGGKSPSLRRHLQSGRGTSEVAWLNGAVARAAQDRGRRAPVNARLAELVEECGRDPERWAWFRGQPDRFVREMAAL